MDPLKGGTALLFLAFYLMPGLLGTVVYDAMAETTEKRENAERLIHAFVLTLFSTLIVHGVFGAPVLPPAEIGNDVSFSRVVELMASRSLAYLSLAAVAIAALLAYLNNHGLIHTAIKRAGLSRHISKFDVWQDAFDKNAGCWVMIEFNDGKSLLGWPKFYSASEKSRELFVCDAVWYTKDVEGNSIPTEIDGVGVYVSDFSKVVAIIFLSGKEQQNV